MGGRWSAVLHISELSSKRNLSVKCYCYFFANMQYGFARFTIYALEKLNFWFSWNSLNFIRAKTKKRVRMGLICFLLLPDKILFICSMR